MPLSDFLSLVDYLENNSQDKMRDFLLASIWATMLNIFRPKNKGAVSVLDIAPFIWGKEGEKKRQEEEYQNKIKFSKSIAASLRESLKKEKPTNAN